MSGKISKKICLFMVLGIIPILSCATTPSVNDGATSTKNVNSSPNMSYPAAGSQGSVGGSDPNMMQNMQQQMQQQMMKQMMNQNQGNLGGGSTGTMGGGAPKKF